MPLLYLNCLPSFTLGALFAKYDWFAELKGKVVIENMRMNILWIALFVSLLLIRAIIPVDAVNIIFMILFVCWFSVLKKVHWFRWLMEKFGKQSTNMWLVHTFFCYYLFHDWIYSFKYPIVIYTMTILLSYLSGIIIEKLNQFLQKIVFSNI